MRRGEVSPVELVEAAITRIEKLDDELNAVIHRRFERARDDVASATLPDGPFRGVPMVLKDLDGYSTGRPVPRGQQVAQGDRLARRPRQRARRPSCGRAGFVFVGKTNAPEFGLMPTTEPQAYGPTHNPWDPDTEPGGSSGGSAAAVAAGMVPVGHAGDGGGSIRIPSSVCGLFGLKPSRGRVSFGPDEGESWAGLVVRHAVTRSVRDSAAVLDVLAGPDAGRPLHRAAARSARSPTRSAPTREAPHRRAHRRARIGCADTHPDCVAAAEDTAAPARVARAHGRDRVAGRARRGRPHGHVPHDHDAVGRRTTWRRSAGDAGREVTADDVEPLTWAYDELGRSYTADAVPRSGRAAPHAWSRRVATVVGRRVRPAAHADDGGAPARARRPRPPADDPLRARRARPPFAAYSAPFNVTGQPAMSVPLDVERRRPPDRRAARRGVRPRGPAAPGRRAARGRAAVGRPPSARPRLTGPCRVSIAGGQGFYGDTPRAVDAPARRGRRLPLPRGAGRADARDPAEGPPARRDRAATRAISRATWRGALPVVADGRTKVITNAGGINPTAAARAAIETAQAARRLRHQDRDRPRRRPARPARHAAQPHGCDARAPRHRRAVRRRSRATPLFAAAYLGARPIADALAAGRRHRDHRTRRRRRRCSSAPPSHEHGWAWDDWDRLAAGHPRRPPARVLGPGLGRQLLAATGGRSRTRGTCRTRSPTSTPTAPR